MLLHNTSGAFFINVKSNYLTLFLLRFPLFFVFLNCIKMLFHMNTVLMQSGTCQSHFKRVFSPSFLSLVAASAIMILLLCLMLIFFSLLNSSNVSSSVLQCILSILLFFFIPMHLVQFFLQCQWIRAFCSGMFLYGILLI